MFFTRNKIKKHEVIFISYSVKKVEPWCNILSQFKRIRHIPTSEKLADIVFSKLRKIKVEAPSGSKKRRSDQSFHKTLYFRQFRYLFPELEERLEKIAESFPIIDDLHPFHIELIEVLFGTDKIRTALSRINNTRKALKSIERDVNKRLGTSETAAESKKARSEALGRVGSTISKLKKPLDTLIDAKIQLSRVPDFNLTQHTIAFAGGPNAGKSSFVKLVSTGRPEINSYPFTTKELVIGHRKRNQFESVQLMDTPGLLDRPLAERNAIEMRSILALKYLTDIIVFLYDPSVQSPLSLEQQLNLLEEIRVQFEDIPIICYINKQDTLTKKELAEVRSLVGNHEAISTLEENSAELERIIIEIIDSLPPKKLIFDKKKEKKIIEEPYKKRVKEDKVEWIFFDEEDSED